ncbi:hypothetical protein BD560DRAFT_130239 [Blakeslea trispora]|nr:hypothetical protein BD560DRAFT_130239 [Blakeslea trispora]
MLLKHSLYVITGANRGFGKTIAETIAKNTTDKKTTLVLVGRDASQLESIQLETDTIACHRIANANLGGATEAKATVIDQLDKLLKSLRENDVAPITHAVLINNAGSIGDMSKKVSQYTPEEIQEYMNINVTSYSAIVTGFLQLFNNGLVKLSIVNISSIVAIKEFPYTGLYSTGKAARNMLLQIVATEEPSVRTLNYAPGPLDNDMQKAVRETVGDTEQRELYTRLKNEGKLVKMEDSANKLWQLLSKDQYTSGSHIDYFDVE